MLCCAVPCSFLSLLALQLFSSLPCTPNCTFTNGLQTLEESEANLNSAILTLQSELAKSKDECADLETALEEAAGMQVLAQEVIYNLTAKLVNK